MKQGLSKYIPFIVSAFAAWTILYFIFPYFKYFIDPDGTSYLTISARYATGDIAKAVNGLWSPWACWLTALLIKKGFAAIPASIIVNAAGGTGFMLVTHSLFLRFRISDWAQWCLNIAMGVFLSFAVFWQTFDDLWQAFFMLLILRMLLIDDFIRKPYLWIAIGMVGALSYFSKAYTIPFFVLSTTCCSLLLTRGSIVTTFRIMAVSVTVMLVCSFPWLYMLHQKYEIWTTSTAGALNMSWYLLGHPEWKEKIDILLPPLYPDSPYYWEDPYVLNGHLTHFWDSWHFFGLQILRFGYNCFILLICMLELSVFFPIVTGYMLYRLIFQRRSGDLAIDEKVLYATCLLLPAGYILVHLESRYLWYMIPMTMIAAVYFLQQKLMADVKKQKMAIAILALSFCVFPVWQLKKLYREGEKEYRFARVLNQSGFKGIDMISNLHPRSLSKICYFSGNSFYVISKQKLEKGITDLSKEKTINTETLVKEINRYKVDYYLHIPQSSGKLMNPGFYDLFYENLKDSTGVIDLTPVVADRESGITLYKIEREKLVNDQP